MEVLLPSLALTSTAVVLPTDCSLPLRLNELCANLQKAQALQICHTLFFLPETPSYTPRLYVLSPSLPLDLPYARLWTCVIQGFPE